MAELFWVVAFPYTTLVSDDICLVLPWLANTSFLWTPNRDVRSEMV